uniref:ABC transporter domain-containing protein n=1 Tax=Eutreptiella gymnastica TaxID=73025 RepID=A0A7S4LLK4_9EUGL
MPFFSKANERRWLAIVWFVAAVVLLGGESMLLVWFSYAQKAFTTSMSEKKEGDFWQAVGSYMKIVLIACPIFALTEFAEARFVFQWRKWLTRHCMQQYWSGRCFYNVARDDMIDHPDQRICEDVNHFTSRACSLLMKVAAKLVNVVSFVAVLWSISPSLVVFLVIYSLITTIVTTLIFGERLEKLELKSRITEAEFRCNMMRGREHSEEIAFYNGGGVELAICSKSFRNVMEIASQQINVGFMLQLFQYTVEYVTVIMPYVIVAERYFKGEMEFGVLSQTAMAFRVIQGGLNVLVKVIARMAALAAETERIHELLTTLGAEADKETVATVQAPYGADIQAEVAERSNIGLISRVARSVPEKEGVADAPPLLMDRLMVLTPDRKYTLWRQLDLVLHDKESLLIVGPSGCGKSSLLRAIAGLFTAGDGRIEMPADTRPYFLPQKPYIPVGSLRDQLMYGNPSEVSPSMAKLEDHLHSVGLGGLAGRVGGWHADHDVDFASMLSLGEQQRVAVARLLCCAPTMCFLDECTSALDEQNEAKMYSLIREAVPCYISVGHRRSLVQFHTHVLKCLGDGGWTLMSPAQYQATA